MAVAPALALALNFDSEAGGVKGKQYTGSAENGAGVICMQNRESRWNSGISGGSEKRDSGV